MYICMKMNDNDNTELFGTCWGEYRNLEKEFRDTERLSDSVRGSEHPPPKNV